MSNIEIEADRLHYSQITSGPIGSERDIFFVEKSI